MSFVRLFCGREGYAGSGKMSDKSLEKDLEAKICQVTNNPKIATDY